MKKNNVVAIVLFLLLSFLLMGCTSNIIGKSSNDNTISDEDKKIETGIKKVEKIITTDSPLTYEDMTTMDHLIDTYKDEDKVKGELKTFIVNKANAYLNNKTKNKNLFDKIEYAVMKLNVNYENDDKIHNLYSLIELDDNSNKDTTNATTSTTNTQQSQQPKNLTSQDGNLELLNNSCSDGYIVGTIKNNSNYVYSYVEVDINLLDANGNQVGSTLANVNNLQANSTWKFKAVVTDQGSVKKYKIIKIAGNN